MLKTRLYILFFFLYQATASADDANLTHLTVKDGLVNNTVYYAMQDAMGFIWFCTETGVSRYDGHKFEDFTMNDGLADNVIFKCYEDSRHRIWFLSYNGRLSYYQNGKIYNSDNDPRLFYPLTWAFLLQCTEDKWGNIWFSTSLNDVIKVNDQGVTLGKSSYFTRNYSDQYFSYVFLKENDSVKKFSVDPANGNLYLQNVLSGTILKTGRVPDIYLQNEKKDRPEFCDKSSTLFIDKKELLCYSKGAWYALDCERHGITSNLLSFLQDPPYIWLATDGQGVYKIDLRTGATMTHILEGERVTKIMKDNEKDVWFVTNDDGVFALKNNPQLFTTVKTDATFSVCALEYDSKSYLLCGNNKGTVYIIKDGEIQKSIHFSNQKFNRALDIISLGGADVLIGFDAGLFAYNIQTGKTTEYSQFRQGYKNYTRAPDSSIWVCGPNGIAKIKNHQLSVFKTQSMLIKYTAIAVPSDSVYYVGTINALYRVPYDGSNYKVVMDDHVLKTQVTGLAIVNGNLLVATHGNGIFIVKDDKIVQHINKDSNGIISDICQKIYDDGKKYIWIATNEGISVISRDNFKLVSNINSDIGIAVNDIKNIATDNERIYTATSEGTSIFKLSEVQFKSSPPVVYVTGYKKGNEKVEYPHGPIELDYFKGFITISFTAIALQYVQNIQYEYKFADAPEWRSTLGTDVSFFSLGPGTHSLMFRAKKFNSDWSAPVLLTIIINPLWYQTIWFKVVIGLLILLAGFIIIQWRLKAIRKKEKEEHEYTRKITDLESKALITQMNPHFIFNSLNTVQQLILVKEEQLSLDYLADFSILMRTMLDNSRKPFISLAEEIDFLNRYLQLETIRFSDKFAYHISVDEKLVPEKVKIPPVLLQPLLENAVKHGISSAKANGFISLTVYRENDCIVAVIEDNGIGIYKHRSMRQISDIKKESTALKVLEERLKLIRNNKGEESSLKITDKGDENDKTSGTIIELRILIQS